MWHAWQHPVAPETKKGKYTGRIGRAPELTAHTYWSELMKTGTQVLFVLQHSGELENARNTWTSHSTVCIANKYFYCQLPEMWLWSFFCPIIISPETPDSVSIALVNNLTSVVEEREFQLQCDITNVAPARNLTVLWYHGNETLEPHVRGLYFSQALPFLSDQRKWINVCQTSPSKHFSIKRCVLK